MPLVRVSNGGSDIKPDLVYQLINVGSAAGYNMFDFRGLVPTNATSEGGYVFNLPDGIGSVANVGTSAIKITANVGMTVSWGTGRTYQHQGSIVHLDPTESLSMTGMYVQPGGLFCITLD